MPKCKVIKKTHTKVCAGDMDEEITLRNRNIKGVTSGVDFTEEFSRDLDVWAMLETLTGVTAFDNTNTEKVVTHKFLISFVEGVTAETWVLFKSKNYVIVNVENPEERDEYLVLLCYERGASNDVRNHA
jgi:SPP1 family predicted phage head-tail adaptor